LTYGSEVNFNWTDDRQESIELGLEYAARALELDASIPQIYLTRSILYLAQRRHEAVVILEESVQRNPVFERGQLTLADERRNANYRRPQDLDHYLDALRKAGVPEQ
jgi:hypothetical protein